MEKRDILLGLMGLPVGGRNLLMSPIQIMKALFLLKMELGLSDSEFYRFEPYLYGPCSFEVYSDLENLIKEGLVVTIPSSSTWTYYRVTSKGSDKAEKILRIADEDLINEIIKVKKCVTSKSFLELLKYVYQRYPKYAENSIVNIEAV